MRDLPILLVDDEPAQVEMLGKLLQIHGFQSVGVHSIQDAYDQLDAVRYGAVLLDLGMPGYAGMDAISALMAKHPEVPIIVLSGRSAEEHAGLCIAAGAQEFIQKGATPRKILIRILTAVVRHQVRGQFKPVEDLLDERKYQLERIQNEISGDSGIHG